MTISPELQIASEQWRRSLTDYSKRNRLLYFKETASTVEIGDTITEEVRAIICGEPANSEDFQPPEPSEIAINKRLNKLASSYREKLDERGVSVAYLAVGFIQWERTDDSERRYFRRIPDESDVIRAPLVLWPLEFNKPRRGSSWEINRIEGGTLNEILLDEFQDWGIEFDREPVIKAITALEDETDLNLANAQIENLFDELEAQLADHSEITIQRSLVIGEFFYHTIAQVRDVTNLQMLAESTVARALAGEEQAIKEIRSTKEDPSLSLNSPDKLPLQNEFLVLDADSSQSFAINSALTGKNLVIQGPPGTGKSQTIANLAAALIADGKSVLFVAQKRAAIEAVLERLERVGLSSYVADLFGAKSNKRNLLAQLAKSDPGLADHSAISDAWFAAEQERDLLVEYHHYRSLPRHAWGISLQDIDNLIFYIPLQDRPNFQLLHIDFGSWDGTTLAALARKIDQLWHEGTWQSGPAVEPGWNPQLLADADEVRKIVAEIDSTLYHTIPHLQMLLNEAAQLGKQKRPERLAESAPIVRMQRDLGIVQAELGREFYENEIQNVVDLVGFNKDSLPKLSFKKRHKLKKITRGYSLNLNRRATFDALERAIDVYSFTNDRRLAHPHPHADGISSLVSDISSSLARIQAFVRGVDLSELTFTELENHLELLLGTSGGAKAISIAEARQDLTRHGIAPYLSFLDSSIGSEFLQSGGDPGQGLKWAILSVIRNQARRDNARLARMSGAELANTTAEFQRLDRKHLAENSARIVSLLEERKTRTVEEHFSQYRLLTKQTRSKRSRQSIRETIGESIDIVRSRKPVFAMSPINVSHVLPLAQLFDVVVFDEASQVSPAEAIPAILRAKQVVVAGDSKQLPPTAFFKKDVDSEDVKIELQGGDSPQLGTLTEQSESILDSMDRLLHGQSRTLLWHYRSLDERLIQISNALVYNSSLITFPRAQLENVLQHTVVPYSPGVNGTTNSPEAEVSETVRQVVEHVRARPKESLGVITFGLRHQQRIVDAIELESARDSKLRAWMEKQAEEPFFVKSIENVQGDERDAVIITLGYGKTPDGNVRYSWGPVMQLGGERRVNVAISRSKRRMSLITSFAANELDKSRSSSAGYQLLYRFINFAALGGVFQNDTPPPPLNPFELDIKARLEERGMKVTAQHGVGRFRLDFAVHHPEIPDRYVLAIEADGASYHSGSIARERDRLRQRALEDKGWVFYRIWSTDWFNDSTAEIDRIWELYESEVAKVTADQQNSSSVQQTTYSSARQQESATSPSPSIGRAPRASAEHTRYETPSRSAYSDPEVPNAKRRRTGNQPHIRPLPPSSAESNGSSSGPDPVGNKSKTRIAKTRSGKRTQTASVNPDLVASGQPAHTSSKSRTQKANAGTSKILPRSSRESTKQNPTRPELPDNEDIFIPRETLEEVLKYIRHLYGHMPEDEETRMIIKEFNLINFSHDTLTKRLSTPRLRISRKKGQFTKENNSRRKNTSWFH